MIMMGWMMIVVVVVMGRRMTRFLVVRVPFIVWSVGLHFVIHHSSFALRSQIAWI